MQVAHSSAGKPPCTCVSVPVSSQKAKCFQREPRFLKARKHRFGIYSLLWCHGFYIAIQSQLQWYFELASLILNRQCLLSFLDDVVETVGKALSDFNSVNSSFFYT